MEDRVILDTMDDLWGHQGSMVIHKNQKLYFKIWTLIGFLTRNLEDRVILDTMDDLGGPQGSSLESFGPTLLHLAEL